MRRATASTVILMLVLAASVGAGAASADSASPAVKMRVEPHIINFRKPRGQSVTTVRGRLLNRKAGIRVVLEASRWPFNGGFRPVGKARTRRGGRFAFRRRPSLATRYRVAAPALGVHSRFRPVYLLPGYTRASCSITGNGLSGGCHNFSAPNGVYTLRIAYNFIYPRSTYATESAKPVFLYYGQRDGSRRYPEVMALQTPTFPQTPFSPRSTQLVMTHSITLPGADWAMYWAACTQTTESVDGLGLPGAAGSWGCGGSTTTRRRVLFGAPLG
jgi:hypothetical protein